MNDGKGHSSKRNHVKIFSETFPFLLHPIEIKKENLFKWLWRSWRCFTRKTVALRKNSLSSKKKQIGWKTNCYQFHHSTIFIL